MFTVSDLFDEVGETPKGKPQVVVSPGKAYSAYLKEMGLSKSVRNVAAAKMCLKRDCLRKFSEGVHIKIVKDSDWSMVVLAAKEIPSASPTEQMVYAESERSAGLRLVAKLQKDMDQKRLQEVL